MGAIVGISIGLSGFVLALIALIVIKRNRWTRYLRNSSTTEPVTRIKSEIDTRSIGMLSPDPVVEVGDGSPTIPEIFSGRKYQGGYVHELGVEQNH